MAAISIPPVQKTNMINHNPNKANQKIITNRRLFYLQMKTRHLISIYLFVVKRMSSFLYHKSGTRLIIANHCNRHDRQLLLFTQIYNCWVQYIRWKWITRRNQKMGVRMMSRHNIVRWTAFRKFDADWSAIYIIKFKIQIVT